jgi:hypothetical protein
MVKINVKIVATLCIIALNRYLADCESSEIRDNKAFLKRCISPRSSGLFQLMSIAIISKVKKIITVQTAILFVEKNPFELISIRLAESLHLQFSAAFKCFSYDLTCNHLSMDIYQSNSIYCLQQFQYPLPDRDISAFFNEYHYMRPRVFKTCMMTDPLAIQSNAFTDLAIALRTDDKLG